MELPAFAFITLLQTCLAAGIVAFLVRILPWARGRQMDSPFVPTHARTIEDAARALECGDGDVVYELGSGDGRFLLACAKLSPSARYVGIERNPFLHLLALIRARFSGNPRNVAFRRKDFFDVDLSEATKIYVYLLPAVLGLLRPKFERELKGARLVSCAFRLSGKEPAQTIRLPHMGSALGQNILYVYEF